MTKERCIDILVSYIDNDLACADIEYVKDTLESICTREELKELGVFDWLMFEEDDYYE